MDPEQSYECDVCARSFESLSERDAHVRERHRFKTGGTEERRPGASRTAPEEDDADVRLRRGILISALLGLGLSESTLVLRDKALEQRGVEYRSVLVNYRRVHRKIYLRDINSAGETLSIHPVLLAIAAIAATNLLAGPLHLGWWWSLPLWRIPFLFIVDQALVASQLTNAQWMIAHFVALLVWLGLFSFLGRTYLTFHGAHPSGIIFRVDGIPKKARERFMTQFTSEWGNVKGGFPASPL
jgi:hypothetical protein